MGCIKFYNLRLDEDVKSICLQMITDFGDFYRGDFRIGTDGYDLISCDNPENRLSGEATLYINGDDVNRDEDIVCFSYSEFLIVNSLKAIANCVLKRRRFKCMNI